MTMRTSHNVGSTVVCAETGKPFVIASDGFTFNYATNDSGQVFSDEGVRIRESRELLNRSKPFTCYLSSDGKHVTGWKGNILGTVIRSNPCTLTRRSHWHDSSTYRSVRIVDIHGNQWHGRGSAGIIIHLRACKGQS